MKERRKKRAKPCLHIEKSSFFFFLLRERRAFDLTAGQLGRNR
jgi:hypothetical protein